MNGALAAIAAALCLALLLLPGFGCTTFVRSLRATDRLGAAYVLSCFLGYAAFWVYWLDSGAGRAFTIGVLIASALRLVFLAFKRDPRVLIPGTAWVLCLYVLVVMLYSSLPWT